jgi:C1A family cysteine protease
MEARVPVPGEFETGLSAFRGHPIKPSEDVAGTAATRRLGRVEAKLAERGIVDAEQLLGATAVEGVRAELVSLLGVDDNEMGRILEAAEQSIPAPLVPTLQTPAPADLELGVLEPTPEMLYAAIAIPPIAAPAELPPNINWVRFMPPIRDQSGRGTCVAFTLTAVHEFFNRLQGNPQDFSAQHLYYETKLVDGQPNACGTWQVRAAQVLQRIGQCRDSVWTYNPNPPCNQPGPAPGQAQLDAARYKLTIQALNPRQVIGIKAALASGSVATLSIPVYNSWYKSQETRRSGRITMKIGNEASVGGHAVCLVGYQDEPTAPGGGYFIVRNSWGPSWASQSPYGAGYGTIPYQYVTDDNWESYTISSNRKEPSMAEEQGVGSKALMLAGDVLVVPGTSQLLQGNLGSAALHAVGGLVARALLGWPGLLLVALNSYSSAATGKSLPEKVVESIQSVSGSGPRM